MSEKTTLSTDEQTGCCFAGLGCGMLLAAAGLWIIAQAISILVETFG